MIIFSETGKKPDEKALDAFLKQKNTSALFFNDGKIYRKQSPSKEYMDDSIFKNKYPYILSDEFRKNEHAFAGFWNPFIVGIDDDDNWVCVSEGKIVPLFKPEVVDDVSYSNKNWDKKPSTQLSLLKTYYSYNQQRVLNTGTNKFELAYATYDSDRGCWVTNTYKYPTKVFRYSMLIFDKRGWWELERTEIDAIPWEELISGDIKNKKYRKIEKYIFDYIRETKDALAKMSYAVVSETDYYEAEIQAAHLILFFCRLLRSNLKLICEENLTMLADRIYETGYQGSVYDTRLEDYFQQHIDKVKEITSC